MRPGDKVKIKGVRSVGIIEHLSTHPLYGPGAYVSFYGEVYKIYFMEKDINVMED